MDSHDAIAKWPGDRAGLRRAADWLAASERVVVFSGAGISAESGIATFRETGGLWSRFDPERFATLEGLVETAVRQPRQFGEFLLEVLGPVARAVPNPGHLAVAEIERHRPAIVVTQNVDALHQQAGSTIVHEVHGSLFDVTTLGGRRIRRVTRDELQTIAATIEAALAAEAPVERLLAATAPLLGLAEAEPYRPGIVLFGEAMAEPAWSDAVRAARQCDVMIVVGTSAEVFPAATLPVEATAAGAKVVTIDPDGGRGDIVLHGPAGGILPQLVAAAFESQA